MSDKQEPAYALARELAEAKGALETEDKSLCRRIRKVGRRVKALEEAGLVVGKSLEKIAWNAKINNVLTLAIVVVLVVIRWPELAPLLLKGALKAVGL